MLKGGLTFRIRGIPETVTDVLVPSLAIFQELEPDILVERLEIERAHHALTKRREPGPPRDNVVKLLDYRSKEQLLGDRQNATKCLVMNISCLLIWHPVQLPNAHNAIASNHPEST